jgi:hypothetical protein
MAGASVSLETSSVSALPDEEDRECLIFRYECDWVQSFETALGLLDEDPWYRLYPLHVHPDLGRQVREAVQERFRKDRRGDRSRDRWQRLCHGRWILSGSL